MTSKVILSHFSGLISTYKENEIKSYIISLVLLLFICGFTVIN